MEYLEKLELEFTNLAENAGKAKKAEQLQGLFNKHIESTAPLFKAISNEKNSPIIIELVNEQRTVQAKIKDYVDTLSVVVALDGVQNVLENYVLNKEGIITVLNHLK